MSTPRFRFVLYSLGLHVLPVFWIVWQGLSFERSEIRGAAAYEARRPAITAKLLAGLPQKQEIAAEYPAQRILNADQERPREETFRSRSYHASIESVSGPVLPEELYSPPELNPEKMHFQDFLMAGRLTRLPAPLTEIDLNAPTIAGIEATGSIAMTVLIDASGLVVDVIASAQSDDLRILADRVAERFRTTRFSPGEIDGKPVQSQLQITVVSEALSPLER